MADLIGLDPHSPTWRAVTAWATERLATARDALEAEGLPLEQTAATRREIGVLKELLDLIKPAPTIKGDDVPYS